MESMRLWQKMERQKVVEDNQVYYKTQFSFQNLKSSSVVDVDAYCESQTKSRLSNETTEDYLNRIQARLDYQA